MKRVNVVAKLAALALLAASSIVHAEVVRYNFTALGTISDYHNVGAEGSPPNGIVDLLPASASIAGSFFYDTTLQAVFTGPNYNSYYSTTGIGVALTSNAGYQFANNITTEYGQPSVSVDDSNPDDVVKVSGGQTDSHGDVHDVTLTFTGKDTLVLTQHDLPHSLSLDDFNGVLDLHWQDSQGNYFNYKANIDTLTLAAAVPEAETYAMLLSGLALVGVAGRRKQQRAPKFSA